MSYSRARRTMARAGFRRKRGRRSGGKFEMQQLSICRFGMQTGLSSCTIPDQFMTPLMTARMEWQSAEQGAQIPNVTVPPLVAGAILVKGIRFDYHYSYVPDIVSDENAASGVTSIRSAVVLLPIVGANVPDTSSFDIGLLFRSETTPAAQLVLPEAMEDRFRVLWRGQDMLNTILLKASQANNTTEASFSTPFGLMDSRHVEIKVACRVDQDHGIFFMSEIVNPFIADNPTIALDLFGVLAMKQSRAPGRGYK